MPKYYDTLILQIATLSEISSSKDIKDFESVFKVRIKRKLYYKHLL